MSTSKHLGRLLNLWIWHDFSGNGPYQNWYLSTVSFDDMTTNERYENLPCIVFFLKCYYKLSKVFLIVLLVVSLIRVYFFIFYS